MLDKAYANNTLFAIRQFTTASELEDRALRAPSGIVLRQYPIVANTLSELPRALIRTYLVTATYSPREATISSAALGGAAHVAVNRDRDAAAR